MNTTWEQLEAAALILARSGPIKDRLADAYRTHLARVNPAELPAALREPLRACREALTREPPLRGEDAVRATVRKMSPHEADEVACSVVRLFAGVARELAHGAEQAALGSNHAMELARPAESGVTSPPAPAAADRAPVCNGTNGSIAAASPLAAGPLANGSNRRRRGKARTSVPEVISLHAGH